MPLRPALFLTILATPTLAEITTASETTGFALVTLDQLPPAPAAPAGTEFCAHLFLPSPETAGGREAQAKGWQVTAELPFGDLTAVSFIGSAVPATSGTCELTDGNVGLFSGGALVALLYGTEPGEPVIGSIRRFGEAGIRVLSGDLVPATMADLVRDSDRITATDPARDEPVCNGTAIIPQIEGFPIDETRARLIRAGWQPVPGDPAEQAFGLASALATAVPEVQSCAGTGFGFCSYLYSGPAGDLTVVTAGEGGENGGLPPVVRFWAECR